MTAICVPIFIKTGLDFEEAITEAEDQLTGTSGMIELRCDTATPKQMLEAIDLAHLPIIVTIRPTWEGGFSQKTDKERIALWEAAMDAGADYIDVELVAWEKSKQIRDIIEETAEKNGTHLILSNHSFEGRPKDLPQRLERLRAIDAARIHKIAWKAESIQDAIDALYLTQPTPQQKRPVLALAMGEEGLLSRLLAKKFSAPFTFAISAKGKESAPGQPTVADLRNLYRWDSQSESIPLFGVVGWPISHSLSPHIHNAGFDALNLPGVYVPLPIKPDYEHFAAAIDALRASPTMNLRGLSVTIPHKENALRYVSSHQGSIDPLSQHIGVINTILFPPDTSPRGLNSDYAGALDALASAWDGKRESLAGKHIAVIGAGGVARAIVAGLVSYGAHVTIYNRTLDKAQSLAADFKALAAPFDSLPDSNADAYINCTPLGMTPNTSASPITGNPAWTADTVVFDTVYNPLKTQFIKLAERKNAKTVLGTEMFLGQAAIQFKAFTGQDAPLDILRKALLHALRK